MKTISKILILLSVILGTQASFASAKLDLVNSLIDATAENYNSFQSGRMNKAQFVLESRLQLIEFSANGLDSEMVSSVDRWADMVQQNNLTPLGYTKLVQKLEILQQIKNLHGVER